VPAVLLDEAKYESIGSSPDIDGRGPMKAHAPQSWERRTEGYGSGKALMMVTTHATRSFTRHNDIIVPSKYINLNLVYRAAQGGYKVIRALPPSPRPQ